MRKRQKNIADSLSLLEKLLEHEGMSQYSSQGCCSSKSMNKSVEKSSDSALDEGKIEVQANKPSEENKVMEPVMKTNSKRFMSSVLCQENLEKVQIREAVCLKGQNKSFYFLLMKRS